MTPVKIAHAKKLAKIHEVLRINHFFFAGDTGQTEARVALHPVRITLCIYRRQLFQRMHSLSQAHAAGDPGFNEFIPKQSCMY